MAEEFWKTNLCCIVTGASGGFGKAICIQFAQRFLQIHENTSEKKISFVLMGRSQNALDELQKQLDSLGPNVHVIEVITTPLEDVKTLRTFENAIKTFGLVGPKYEHALFIHNAGSLSDPNKLVSHYSGEDTDFLASYAEINFSSMVKLSGAFLRTFLTSTKCTLVNISSLLALQPFKGLALYGAYKAARDSYFRSITCEYSNITSLSYSPGILDTPMADLLKKQGFNKELFCKPSNVLDPNTSAKKLIALLESGKYTRGEHFDYYDEIS